MAKENRMIEEWKETLKERSQAMMDGAIGIVIALAAYVLMSVPVAGWSQWWVLLGSFMLIFWVVVFLWDYAANALALAPYDSRLFVLGLFLVVLLIPLPFSARLVFSSEVKGLGATFLVINTGVVFALAALISIIALRTPESRAMPRWALADFRAAPIGLMAGSLVAFLSLLIPSEETVAAGPWVDIPMRAFGLAWAFLAFFVVLMVATALIRRRMPISANESPEVQKMSQVFYSKMRAMYNQLFGMALGLSAFSLTDLPVKAAADIIPPLAHFAFLFFLIVVSWNKLFRVYAAISTFDELIDFLIAWVAFFVVLAPPVFRLVVVPDPVTREIGSIAFPIVMAMLALTNGVLYLHTGGFWRREVAISSEIKNEFRWWAMGSLALGAVFLASLLIPLAATLGHVSLRVIVWWISLASFVAIMWLAAHVTSPNRG